MYYKKAYYQTFYLVKKENKSIDYTLTGSPKGVGCRVVGLEGASLWPDPKGAGGRAVSSQLKTMMMVLVVILPPYSLDPADLWIALNLLSSSFPLSLFCCDMPWVFT